MTPGFRAFELISGYRAAQLVGAAAELKIPDLLAVGPMTSEQLSDMTGIDRGRLHRMLRGLVALGVLAEQEDGSFSNTDVGEVFRDGVPGSRRPMAMMMIPHDYSSWGHFMETLRTGVTGQQLAHGGTLWADIERDAEFRARFNEAMAVNSKAAAELVSREGDFDHASLIVDVGGGKGALAGGILLSHPHLRGIVCDLPAGLADAPDYLTGLGVIERCAIIGCDFFKAVPDGGDIYLLKDILHDWDDHHATAILSVCRKAMSPGARLMVVERSLPARVGEDPLDYNRILTDLHMMVLLGGRERTLEEFRALFDATQFRLTRSVPGEPFGIIEAVAS
ncbi:MAG TPA: methyltransferase [Candidatus Dormibacteraeota bacterium]|nr:methyltransferase [Candidatus Dormibacteraeota bacterium]